MIKSDIKNGTSINIHPVSHEDINLGRSREMVPDSLYKLLNWVVCKDVNPYVVKNESAAEERHILTLGQDIIHCASHGRKKTTKHVGLAMSVRHLTGSKQLINMLTIIGHCSSYEDVEAVDTSIARELTVSPINILGVITPSTISPGAFVQAAADNNDINEETLDGKHITHSRTVGSVSKRTIWPKAKANLVW